MGAGAIEHAPMPDTSTLALFLAATAALLLVPGPSVLFVVARSLEHGRGGGLASVLGVEVGALLHVAAATVGLSALIASSPALLTVIKFAGAAYLIVLGLRSLRPGRQTAPRAAGAASRRSLFRQGLLVDALNPKTGMFFLAFLPQFIDPAAGSVAMQTAVLGLCFVALATVSDTAYAVAAGEFAKRLRRSPRMRERLDRGSGVAYVALGAVTGVAPS
jgi:threonine/homoserine/homoserine lactone efflux protein